MGSKSRLDREERRVEVSGHISSIALVLIPLVIGVIGFALQFRQTSVLFWALSLLSVMSLAMSLYMGGHGISRLPQEKSAGFSSFNAQAVLCIVGFLSMLSLYFVLGEEKPDKKSDHMSSLIEDVADLKIRVNDLENVVGNQKIGIAAVQREQADISRSLEDLDDRVNRLASPAVDVDEGIQP